MYTSIVKDSRLDLTIALNRMSKTYIITDLNIVYSHNSYTAFFRREKFNYKET